jgi:DNA-binding response OmpR family regulator
VGHILIVDDECEIRELLKTVPLVNGFEVTVACDGIEAPEKLRSTAINLIISDVLMSWMDGFHLCREIKADVKLKAVPNIFITRHYTDAEDQEPIQLLGADLVLYKTFELKVLLEKIQRIVERPNDNRTGIPSRPPPIASVLTDTDEPRYS